MNKIPDGFIKWKGKTATPPVHGLVEVILKNRGKGITHSDRLFWLHNNFSSDIVAYRPLEPQYHPDDVAFKKEQQMNKYQRLITGKPFIDDDGTTLDGLKIDVYDVLKAFNVTNPATQHAIKKLLASGQRGYKDTQQDLDEAIQSIQRAKELEE
jgi:hypothetical protein